jgi:Kef-type K+ transport system membrane component KefB
MMLTVPLIPHLLPSGLWPCLLRGATLLAGLLLTCVAARAQGLAGEVRVGARTAFVIEEPVGTFSAEERASIVNRRVERILTDPALDPASIEVRYLPDGAPAIMLGDFAIVEVTPADADAYSVTPDEVAEQWARALRTDLIQLKPLLRRQPAEPPVRKLSEHRVLILIGQVALLLLLAVACGEGMRRLGQAPVIGQLLAGILLGPSVFGAVLPQAQALIFPASQTQGYLLEVISWLGVLFLLLLTGLETDVALITSQGRPALYTAVAGSLFPFAGGYLVGLALPDALLVDPARRSVFALFLGTALSISSVPVIAKILMDMRLLRRNVGQVTLAAAIAHDTGGWLALAAIAGLAASGSFSVKVIGAALFGTLLFTLLLFTVGRRAVTALLRWVHDHVQVEEATLTTVIVLTLAGAVATQLIGVHAVLGAFLVGVLLSRSPLVGHRVIHPIEAVTMAILAPVFFAGAGLNVDLSVLTRPSLLGVALAVTGVACLTKIAGCYAGGRWGGMGHWEALSLGLGTNARGAMGLIVAILGFSLQILTVDMFSIIVLMAVLTTAMTPPLLRWALGHVVPSPEEQARLEREAFHAASFLSRVRRVLLPTHGGPHAALAARLLGGIKLPHPIEVTALWIDRPGDKSTGRTEAPGLRDALQGPNVSLISRVTQADDPAEAILKEAARRYDLLSLGCGMDAAVGEHVFGHLTDRVAHGAPCPLLVVRAPRGGETWRLRRILAPTTGEEHTMRAVELTIALAHGQQAAVTALHVAEAPETAHLFWLPRAHPGLEEVDAEFLEQAAVLGESFGVPVECRITRGAHAGSEIVRVAEEVQADLIFMGVSARPSRRMFLGETVAQVLRHATCAVAVFRP